MSEEVVKTSKNVSPVHAVGYTFLILALGASAYFNYLAYMTPSVKSSCGPLKKAHAQLQLDYKEAIESIQTLNAQESTVATVDQQAPVPTEDPEPTPPPAEEPAPVVTQLQESMPVNKNLVKVKDFAKCYDMGQGIYEISKKCRKDIITYVDKHKDAKYFEIIGLVDKFEFKLFSLFDKTPSLYEGVGTNKKSMDKIRKYTQFGLAKFRASEASWVIKAYTKQKAHTYNANYHLVSKKDYKGVVIRAYK